MNLQTEHGEGSNGGFSFWDRTMILDIVKSQWAERERCWRDITGTCDAGALIEVQGSIALLQNGEDG
jgi:hypothetical protein